MLRRRAQVPESAFGAINREYKAWLMRYSKRSGQNGLGKA